MNPMNQINQTNQTNRINQMNNINIANDVNKTSNLENFKTVHSLNNFNNYNDYNNFSQVNNLNQTEKISNVRYSNSEYSNGTNIASNNSGNSHSIDNLIHRMPPLNGTNPRTSINSNNPALPFNYINNVSKGHSISSFDHINLPNPITSAGSVYPSNQFNYINPVNPMNPMNPFSQITPVLPNNLINTINSVGSANSVGSINSNQINQMHSIHSINNTSPQKLPSLLDIGKLFDLYPDTNCIFYPHEKLFNLVNVLPRKIVLHNNNCKIILDSTEVMPNVDYICDMSVICLNSSKYLKSKYLIQCGQMEIIKLCKDYENDIPLLGGIFKTEIFCFTGSDMKILNNFKIYEDEINRISEKLILKYSNDLATKMKENPEISAFFTKATRIITVKKVYTNTLLRYSRSFAKMLYIMHNINNFSFIDEYLKVTKFIDFPLQLDSNHINHLEVAYEDLIYKLLTRSDLIPLWYKLFTVCCFQFNRKKNGGYKVITPVILRDLVFCVRQWCKYAFLHNYCNQKMTYEDIKQYFSDENKFSVWMWLKNISKAAIKDYKVYRNPTLKKAVINNLTNNGHYSTIQFITSFYNFVKAKFDENVNFLSNMFESGLLGINNLGEQILFDHNVTLPLTAKLTTPLSSFWNKSLINKIVPKGKKYDSSYHLVIEKVNQCALYLTWMVFLSVGGLIDLNNFRKIKMSGKEKNISIDPKLGRFYIMMETLPNKKNPTKKHILDKNTTLYLLYYYVILKPILLDQLSIKCINDIFYDSFKKYNHKENGLSEAFNQKINLEKCSECFLIFEATNCFQVDEFHVQFLYENFLKVNNMESKLSLNDFKRNLIHTKNHCFSKNPYISMMEFFDTIKYESNDIFSENNDKNLNTNISSDNSRAGSISSTYSSYTP